MPFGIPNLRLHNVLRGIVPVASGWDTAPTDLGNCTDGDRATGTGTGQSVKGVAGIYGYLTFDAGVTRNLLVALRVGLWSSAGSASVHILADDANNPAASVLNGIANGSRTTATELIIFANPGLVSGRYVYLTFYVGVPATAYAKVYEVVGWELM